MTYNENMDYTDQMRSILSCSYIVKNENELEEVINNLKKGIDPLKAEREILCDREFIGDNNIYASKNMKRFLIEKYSE